MESAHGPSLLLVLGTLAVVHGFSPELFRIRDRMELQRREKIQQQEERLAMLGKIPRPRYGASQYFVEQTLDHFDASEEGTYKQRVFVNDRYWKSGGPVFLFIGGEGSLGVFDVLGGEHVELAEVHGALLFAVEHRYYGASINMDSLELRNMRFLSSQQALADLATFYEYAMQKYSLTSANTWICFGGSYPGALSAWFRLKYPHIVYGAIASSAPVEAQDNFEGYNDVVAASLADPVVQGSQQCLDNVRKAFSTIDSMLASGQYHQLGKDFMSCNDISSKNDQITFVGNVAGIIMGIVQYNNQMEFRNISTLCRYMTDPSVTPYQALVTFNKKLMGLGGPPCMDNSWADSLASLANTTVEPDAGGVGLRQWIYQTCSQFGYYQTCDKNTTCPFSPLMDLKSNTIICQEIFELSPEDVATRIRFTNDFYGSNRPKGSRIVFVNGSIDPWHALSVLRNQTSEEISIFINGTSHCQNMGSDSPRETPALRAARKEIASIVAQWLSDASKDIPSVNNL